ncbi:MAG: SDR family oxidoreductase [Desulfobacterales bacterium]|nr:SDR family oxidoreductase [Desulfobacterales bacterium]
MATMLEGRRILVTQAGDFMGPTLCEVLAEHGAEVVPSGASSIEAGAAEAVVRDAGRIDVLVANLALPAPSTSAVDVDEAEWRQVFAALVDPLPRLARAVLPQMIERQCREDPVDGQRLGPARHEAGIDLQRRARRAARLRAGGRRRGRAVQRAGQRHRAELR